MKIIKHSAAVLLLVCLFVVSISAESTVIPGLHHYVLDNGMELFVFENHAVPLVTIQITFRCGALAQAPETAGLFHLYEHMLFKGNKVYKSDSDFQAAMKEIGVTSWNGGTSTEYVDYYFTVPADKLGKGLEFWANAARYPLFLEDELETEKQVVLNEIKGYHNDPGRIYESAMNNHLFYLYPWRKDVSGPEWNVQDASRESMLAIQNGYYIPNNAALFIGGDVNPEQALALVNRYFGDWAQGSDPWQTGAPPHPFLKEDVFLYYGDESMYQGLMAVDLRLRGPDVLDDPKATYAADVWLMLLEDPHGRFKTNIFSKVPGVYRKELIDASYYTQRDGAAIYFRTYLVADGTENSTEQALLFKKAIIQEMNEIIKDPEYFSQADFNLVKTRLEDKQLLEMETASQLISSLSFWWSSANTEYYLGYIDNMKKITFSDVKNYIQKYITSRKMLLGVLMNPADLVTKSMKFKEAGFKEIQKANAFWWADK
ncbi:MAG: insulinase family protein [Spirochaetales bacterium]|nr:insulinase family protein [Spirochaetales bacterium]